jgi:hypothetical protein
MVFLWGRKIQTQAYERPSLVAAAADQEIKASTLALDAKARSGLKYST